MKNKRLNKTLLAIFLMFSISSLSFANEIYQDCLLEGKVVADKSTDKTNIVRVDFYMAKPFRPEARCILDGYLEFKQPKGTLIENLSEGSVVQYHYMQTKDNKTSWQLVGAFI